MTETPRDDAPQASGERRPSDVTVLVVDDEVDIATYLASVLEDAGMEVVVAHDGDQALEEVARRPPDLISLDLVMPGRSGVKVLRELRRRREWSRIPVIIVTAHARDPKIRGDLDEVLAESTLTGPSLYLEKPVTPRSYLESVCRVLGVEPPTEEGDPEGLREEALDLLQNADAETLRDVLSQLRRHSH